MLNTTAQSTTVHPAGLETTPMSKRTPPPNGSEIIDEWRYLTREKKVDINLLSASFHRIMMQIFYFGRV